MEDQFKLLDRKLVYHGHVVDFYEDTIQVPNGNIAKWDFIKHKGAAAVVPVLDDGRILMTRQYRNTWDKEILEIPAGGLNENESFLSCSHRELEEETGYHCEIENMELLISIASTVAFCNERVDVYVAKNLTKTEQHLDEDEFIHVKAYKPEELRDMVFSGEIQDAKTIAAIMAYINKYLS